MELSEILTRWSALAAMVGGALVLGCRLSRLAAPPVALRWIWTASYVVFLLHVGFAFQFFHHWSHTAALKVTAERTKETVGVDTGAGLYLNYLFTLLWSADVLWWWCRPASHSNQPGWIDWTFGILFGFMAFNATVVFGGTTARIIGAACMGAVLVLLLVARLVRERRC
jgi:hypothetical protein